MLGCCLNYFHFLWVIHPIRPVQQHTHLKSSFGRPLSESGIRHPYSERTKNRLHAISPWQNTTSDKTPVSPLVSCSYFAAPTVNAPQKGEGWVGRCPLLSWVKCFFDQCCRIFSNYRIDPWDRLKVGQYDLFLLNQMIFHMPSRVCQLYCGFIGIIWQCQSLEWLWVFWDCPQLSSMGFWVGILQEWNFWLTCDALNEWHLLNCLLRIGWLGSRQSARAAVWAH